MTQALLRMRAVALPAALSLALPASAAAATAAPGGEQTPVHLGASDRSVHLSTGGGSLVRTIVGLAVVLAVIYGLAWVLRQVRSGRQDRASGAGLASVATVPLGPGRSLALVRAGRDLVLVGVSEKGVTPIRTYDEEQARAAGLIDDQGRPLGTEPPEGPVAGPGPASAAQVVERLRRWTVRR